MLALYNTCFAARNNGCLPSTTAVVKVRPMALGKRVEQARTAKAWTQTYLAARVSELAGQEDKLSQQAIDRLEKRDSATSEAAVWIAQALGVNLRWLLAGVGQPDDSDWPFDFVPRARWDAYNKQQRGFIEKAMLDAMRDLDKQASSVRAFVDEAATDKRLRVRPVKPLQATETAAPPSAEAPHES